MQQRLNDMKKLFEQESAAKATAESSCAQALEKAKKEAEDNKAALEVYKASETERIRQVGKAAMKLTVEKLQKNVDDAMGKCRQEGMEQGFPLGYTQALIAAAVPRGTDLCEVPAVSQYIDPDVEMSEVPEGGGDDEADADAISKPTPASDL